MVNLKRKNEDSNIVNEDSNIVNLEKKLKVYKDKVSDFLVEKLDDKSKKSIDVLNELRFLFEADSYCYHVLNFAIACCERNLFKINDTQYEIKKSDNDCVISEISSKDLENSNLKIKFNYKVDAGNALEEGYNISFEFIDQSDIESKLMYSFYDYDVDDDKKPDVRIDFNSFYNKLMDEGILEYNLMSR